MAQAPSGRGFTLVGAGEFFLGFGLFSLAVGLGLVPFVVIGLLGLGLILAAVVFLVAAAILVCAPARSVHQSLFGMAINLAGLVLLVASGAEVVSLAAARTRYTIQPFGPEPADLLWPWLVFAGPISAGAWAFGLKMRAGWLQGRVVLWALVAAFVASAAVGLFMILAPAVPLGA